MKNTTNSNTFEKRRNPMQKQKTFALILTLSLIFSILCLPTSAISPQIRASSDKLLNVPQNISAPIQLRTSSSYTKTIPALGKCRLLTVRLYHESCFYGASISSTSPKNAMLMAVTYDEALGNMVKEHLIFDENGIASIGAVSESAGTYVIEIFNLSDVPVTISGSVYYFDY